MSKDWAHNVFTVCHLDCVNFRTTRRYINIIVIIIVINIIIIRWYTKYLWPCILLKDDVSIHSHLDGIRVSCECAPVWTYPLPPMWRGRAVARWHHTCPYMHAGSSTYYGNNSKTWPWLWPATPHILYTLTKIMYMAINNNNIQIQTTNFWWLK